MKMNFPPILFLVLTLLAPLHAMAGTPPVAAPQPSLQSYITQLQQWQSAVGRIKSHPNEAADLEKKLPQQWDLECQGQRYKVPTGWLRLELAAIKANPSVAANESAQIERRLAALRSGAEAMASPAGIKPQTAHSTLNAILSRREFRNVYGEAWRDTLMDRAANWLGKVWRRLFSGLASHPLASTLTVWGLFGGAGIFLLIWLAQLFLHDNKRVALHLEAARYAARPSRDWMLEAFTASERGDYREAIRQAYWAGVFRLGELRVWDVMRDRTPREYLRMLPASDTRRTPLEAVTRCFERSWYGGQRLSPEEFQQVVSHLERLGCVFR
ncbi:MAG: DUF4129 domain-containing protein [Terriglobia bacterium]